MTINQKVEQEYFDHIIAGEKREIRLAADPIHEGDTVILEEWDPHTQEYTGRKIETLVTAVRPRPATNGRIAVERTEETSQLIQFEPKESKYTPAS